MPLDGTDQHDTPLDSQVEGRYTILEAARLLGIHKNTVRHRIATGVYEAETVLTPNGEAYVIPAHYIEAELEAIKTGHVRRRGTVQGYPRIVGQSDETAIVPATDAALRFYADAMWRGVQMGRHSALQVAREATGELARQLAAERERAVTAERRAAAAEARSQERPSLLGRVSRLLLGGD